MAKEKTLEQAFLNKINALTIPESIKLDDTGLQATSDIQKKIEALNKIQNSKEFKSLESSENATEKSFFLDVKFILDAYDYHCYLKDEYGRSFFEHDMPKSAVQMSNNLRDIMALKTNPELLNQWHDYEKDLIDTKSEKNSMSKIRNKRMIGLACVAVIAMFFFPALALPLLAAMIVSVAAVYSYNYYKASQLDKEFLKKHPESITKNIQDAKSRDLKSQIPKIEKKLTSIASSNAGNDESLSYSPSNAPTKPPGP